MPTATAAPVPDPPTPTPPPSAFSDWEALLALYEATDGRNWENNDHWLTGADLGEWHGVTTDANGRVTGLDFFGNGMDGELPPELGNLTNLVVLRIGNDRALTGQIPPELGNLTNLEVLEFTLNSLGGEIPPELGQLSNLRELTIRKNKVTGRIPPELGNLANLEKLDLYINLLLGPIPPELGKLTALRELNLGRNYLRGPIPAEFGNLANLEELSIILTKLTGELPPELGGMVSLRKMELNGNEITGPIPPELGQLANVEELILSGNQLNGEIPAELGQLASVEDINLSGNQLNGEIPAELGNLTRVRSLKLRRNYLSGQIPAELGNAPRLLELSLNGNQLSGCIPDTLRLQHYLAEDLGLEFCDPPVIAADAGEKDRADYFGLNTSYVDPLLAAMLYAASAGREVPDTVRVVMAYDTEGPDGALLEEYLQANGGANEGHYDGFLPVWAPVVWTVPTGLVPSIVCRSDVSYVALPKGDGSFSPEDQEQPYPNLVAVLNDVILAHQAGMPENQAALYAFAVIGSSVAVGMHAPDVETADAIRAWLAERDIYAPLNEYHTDIVTALIPAGQMLPLAEQFPNTYMEAMDRQGLPLLRAQWPIETLHFEKAIAQQFLDPDAGTGEEGAGGGLAPCSTSQ